MIRGTTPRLEFEIPFDTEIIEEAYVTMAQNKEVVIDKPLKECNCDGRKIVCVLTQEETLRLACDCKTEMQIRVRTADGNAIASEIIKVDTERILKDGVI